MMMRILAAVLCTSLALCMAARGETTIHLPSAGEAVLFPFDADGLTYRHGLELNLVAATKHGPVLKPGPAGAPDSARIDYYGSVLRLADGKLHMWYRGAPKENPAYFRVCYATSDDGIKWDRPNLGLVEFNGNKNNNLVDLDMGSTFGIVVLHDPDDPDANRRLKMFCECRPLNYGFVAYSGDGLHWKPSPNNPVVKFLVEPSGAIKRDGMYHITLQGENGAFQRRVLISLASADFEHWADAVALGFRRDAVPPRPYITGRSVGPQVHIGAGLWDRGNVVLGLYGQWNGPPTDRDDRRLMRMNIGLVVSNDGLHYQEPIPDFKLIDAGEEDWSFDDPSGAPACLSQGQGVHNVGDKTVTWYGIWGFRNPAIRAASWTRDRLGYFQPTRKPIEGQSWIDEDRPDVVLPRCISSPIELKAGAGGKIFVNAEGLFENAQLRIELLDKAFRPIAGYSGEDCTPLRKSGLREAVRWRGGDELKAFDGPVRVRVCFEGVRLEDCKLYALYVAADGGRP
jgi:hypothetical protein